ncbi:TIR domain-containing adapter molecule 2 [Anolis carolinensis]|uniref:TIR domain-containing adapter molecule 2 n=1 Tax=Anolis carolinensis TaxID=28377 RepID=R4GAY2_ANOCA|nr:PREDICTED: TIR domain-containing adapter molecule 2 [Anolis carolinensis]XP_016850342.1 PREDICTED: TIR domain-containing adapter molecule 2 [Anolis carolinensis]|eukprot:XP_016850341.1 PREDICTED: TIR domain-containing adapter molecule 2 [Anolis carolinensis]
MGNKNSKRASSFSRRNSMKDNYTNKCQEDLKKKPKLCDMSLGTETNCHISIQEPQSIDEDVGDIFYRFVILHADDDVEEAVRIQDILQNEFYIKPGIIFAEMPGGKHLLENLNDALSSSAWTILLLTENFLNELWYEFQSYTSLFGALTLPNKQNTVIPMRPRNNPLPWERTPFILRSINALQEDSPGFAKQVKKIFQETRYKQQKATWACRKKNQEASELFGW